MKTIRIIVIVLAAVASIFAKDRRGTGFGDQFESGLREEAFQMAVRGGDWLLRNQVVDQRDTNPDLPSAQWVSVSADRGRTLGLYAGDTSEVFLSVNWQMGVSIGALLCLFERTGDAKYKAAAIRMGDYIKTLQILDPEDTVMCGAILERTPQDDWVNPCDQAFAAYGLLCLYSVTGERDYLRRADKALKWYLARNRTEKWINYRIAADNRSMDIQEGVYQAGVGQFYFSLAQLTGHKEYLKSGLGFLADGYIHLFQRKDGSHKLEMNKPEYEPDASRHNFNDNFAGITLLLMYQMTKDKKYLQSAEAFVNWLFRQMNPDGSFGQKKRFYSAHGITLNFMTDYYRMTGKVIEPEKIRKMVKYLKAIQFNSPNPRLDGGFMGDWKKNPAPAVHIRSVAYSILGLLKFEDKRQYSYYSAVALSGPSK